MRSVLMAAATFATSTASSAARRAAAAWVRSTAEANPQVPSTHHPHREAEVVAVEQGLQVAVGQTDVLPPDALGAEVGVLGAEVGGALQRGGRELAQRVGGELGVDPAVAAARGLASRVISHDWQPIPRPAAGPAASLPGGRPAPGPATRYAAQDRGCADRRRYQRT